jgi:hypothetical protein
MAKELAQHISLASVFEVLSCRVAMEISRPVFSKTFAGVHCWNSVRSPYTERLPHMSSCDSDSMRFLPGGEVGKAGVKLKTQQQPLKLLEGLAGASGGSRQRGELRRRVSP